MDASDRGEGRRQLVRTLGAGLLGAALGLGTARGASALNGDLLSGSGRSVVLYGPDGRALPTFRADDPGTVRNAGRGAATGYAQHQLDTRSPQAVRRAPSRAGIWVQVERGEVRVRTDGGDATANTGEVIGAGFAECYDVASLSILGNGGPAVVQTWSE